MFIIDLFVMRKKLAIISINEEVWNHSKYLEVVAEFYQKNPNDTECIDFGVLLLQKGIYVSCVSSKEVDSFIALIAKELGIEALMEFVKTGTIEEKTMQRNYFAR